MHGSCVWSDLSTWRSHSWSLHSVRTAGTRARRQAGGPGLSGGERRGQEGKAVGARQAAWALTCELRLEAAPTAPRPPPPPALGTLPAS